VPVFAVFFVIMLLLKLLGNRIRYKILSVGMSMLLSKTPNKRLAPEIEQYAEAITGTLRKSLIRNGINPKGITFQIEPGRSLYGDTGVHLTTILKTKYQTRPVKYNWVLLDTTYFFMSGGVFELNLHDFIIANKADEKKVMTADVVGRSCFADRMLPEVRVPRVAAGDVMAILDTGAYQEVSASNFNGLPRPATVLVCGDQAEVIKRAETQEDVFARDIIPKRLMKNHKMAKAV
jgi:diaminopimelate decarboxylase